MPSALSYVLASAFLVPGILALLIRDPRRSRVVGFGGGAVASFLGLVVTLVGAMREAPMRIPLPAPVPWAASELFLDGLSAFFLALIFFIGFLVSVYAVGYMKEFDAHRRGQAAPLLLNLLLLSMAFVVSAGDMLSFLLGWEAMSLASYFLVVLDHEKREARQAGLIYLIATHIGTGGILLAFLFLVQTTGSFSFNGFAAVPISDPAILSATFGFALLGFGTKAGIFPFHIWLPYAHPEAPSPVSAVMSGVMIKMGIYGIVRFLFYLLPSPPASFGATLLALGLLSGVFGVLYAIVQHDLKRLLAFHSVENIGIILIGIGAASLCQATGRPDAARLLLAGGLFHVLNHATFKALLFLGAGAVLQGAHTRNIEKLGGLMRGMPLTGVAFLAGSLAISAVPPFNGFASEFAIYRGLWAAAGGAGSGGVFLAAMAGLALIGGLAVVCFVKVVGTVFLGNARSAQASAARDPSARDGIPDGDARPFLPRTRGLPLPRPGPPHGDHLLPPPAVGGRRGPGGGRETVHRGDRAGDRDRRAVAPPDVPAAAERPTRGGNVGVRLPVRHPADAVHRVVVRRPDPARLPGHPPSAHDPQGAALRKVPARGGARDALPRPPRERPLPAGLPPVRAGRVPGAPPPPGVHPPVPRLHPRGRRAPAGLLSIKRGTLS